MKLGKHLSAVVCCLLAGMVVAGAAAEELNPKLLPSTVHTVMHFDVARARASSAIMSTVNELAKRSEWEKVKNAIPTNLSFLKQADLRSVTVYTVEGDTNPVFRFHAKTDAESLVAAMKSAPDFGSVRHGNQRIFSWTVRDKQLDSWFLKNLGAQGLASAEPMPQGKEVTFYFAESGKDQYVISWNLRSMVQALDLQIGAEKPLGKKALEELVGNRKAPVAAGYNLKQIRSLKNGQEPEDNLLPVLVVFDAETQMKLDVKIYFQALELAKQVENMISSPMLLGTMLKTLAEASGNKADTSKAEESPQPETNEEAKPMNSLSIGLGFSSKDIKSLTKYAKEHFSVKRDEGLVDIHWHGLLDVDYDLKVKDGKTHFALQGNLRLGPVAEAAKAKQEENKKRTR